MILNLLNDLSISIELNEYCKNYFKNKYFDYVAKKTKSKNIYILKNGPNRFTNNSEIIRPPIGKCKNGIFIFDNDENSLYTNFNNLGYGSSVIEISDNFNLEFLSKFIDFLVFLKLKQNSSTIIHASSFIINNEVVLCPAWRNVGKTNLLLYAIHSGAKYLSDDWLICDKNGKISEFPKLINLYSYNINTLQNINFENKSLINLKYLKKLINTLRPFDQKIKEEILNNSITYLSQRTFKNSIKKIVKTLPTQIFWLRHKPTNNNIPVIQKISDERIKSHIKGTLEIELYPFFQALRIQASITGVINPIFKLDTDINIDKMLNNCKTKYLIDVPSQQASKEVFNTIKKFNLK